MTAYIHADIYGRDDTAFLVRGNEFARFGSEEEILGGLQKDEETVDLKGQFVLPGFVDSHMHLLGFGRFLSQESLFGMESNDEILEYLKKRIRSYHEGQWMIGRGYRGELTKQLLDTVSTDIPIVLTRVCGHVLCANSKAMELAEITGNIETDGGRVRFDKGIFEENALELMYSRMPAPSDDTIRQWLKNGAAYCSEHGITTVASDDFLTVAQDWHRILKIMEGLGYTEELTVRVNEQCEFPSVKEFSKFLDEGYTTFSGNDFFRIGPLKLICDGSLGGRTAALSRPYQDAPETSGYMTMSDEDIELFVRLAARFNMPTICHAIGDETVEHLLDIFDETVLEGNPLHHGFVHCQIMTKEQTERIIRKKYSCYIQSQFIGSDAPVLNGRVGAARAETSYPFRSLYEGTLCSNGSDAPVEMPDPFSGIYFAVTRTADDGSTMNKDECMSIEQALDTYIGSAYAQIFENERLGKMETGYLADFAVIDRNLLKTDISAIREARVMMTVVNGNTVFER